VDCECEMETLVVKIRQWDGTAAMLTKAQVARLRFGCASRKHSHQQIEKIRPAK
jgi:hypothetical protein